MKKILIGILTTVAIIAILIGGKIQMDKYQMKEATRSEEAKAAIEKMLRKLDDKALTPEGKIKNYKIDDEYTKKNPMGGISITIVVNADENLYLGTILNKYPTSNEYDLGVLNFSPKLRELIYE